MVLSNFNLELQLGEIVFLTGPSGCGKTTALRLLANLDVPDSGSVFLNGKSSKHYGQAVWRTLVTYVPQSRISMNGTPLQLFKRVCAFRARHGTCAEEEPVELSMEEGIPYKTPSDRFIDIAESLDLSTHNVVRQSWSELSGGQAQRAMIALAIATRPKVLLVDEPTSACDPASTILVENALQATNASIVWVSHDPTQPERVAGRLLRFGSQLV